MKILCVDDNRADLILMKTFLAAAGYPDVLTTTDVLHAPTLVEQEQPDIVVTDTNMPRMNGFELCQTIKVRFKDKCKVIVMTGAVGRDDSAVAKEHGADAYCFKTSECEEIIKAIESIR